MRRPIPCSRDTLAARPIRPTPLRLGAIPRIAWGGREVRSDAWEVCVEVITQSPSDFGEELYIPRT